MRYVYAGCFLRTAIEFTRAGFPEKAAWWIEREMGEAHADCGYGSIDPTSIRIEDTGYITFELHAFTKQGMFGDGI